MSKFEERLITLYKGNDSFSKAVKVFQYLFVIAAEYNLMRKVLHMRTGKMPSEVIVKDWYTRLRKMGSALSTSRMALRLFIWTGAIKFFIS